MPTLGKYTMLSLYCGTILEVKKKKTKTAYKHMVQSLKCMFQQKRNDTYISCY